MTGQPLLHRCPHCGIDPGWVLAAIHVLREAADYLDGKPGARVIAPSLEYERGAQHALEWALGLNEGDLFGNHLRALERIRDELVAENAKPTA